MKKRNIALIVFVLLGAFFFCAVQTTRANTENCDISEPFCFTPKILPPLQELQAIEMPNVAVPDWYLVRQTQSQILDASGNVSGVQQ